MNVVYDIFGSAEIKAILRNDDKAMEGDGGVIYEAASWFGLVLVSFIKIENAASYCPLYFPWLCSNFSKEMFILSFISSPIHSLFHPVCCWDLYYFIKLLLRSHWTFALVYHFLLCEMLSAHGIVFSWFPSCILCHSLDISIADIFFYIQLLNVGVPRVDPKHFCWFPAFWTSL